MKSMLNDLLSNIKDKSAAIKLIDENIDELQKRFNKTQTDIFTQFETDKAVLIKQQPDKKDILENGFREKLSEIRNLGKSYEKQLEDYKTSKLLEFDQKGKGYNHYIEIYSDESELIEPSNYNYDLSMTSTDDE